MERSRCEDGTRYFNIVSHGPRTITELRPVAATHLRAYTNPSGGYAFTTYDQAPVHTGPLTVTDVLMANLLSLRLGAPAVIPLFATGNTPQARLRLALDATLSAARGLPPLEDCDDHQVEMPTLRYANELAPGSFPGAKKSPWTAVHVSKVLHRLVRNVPIIDSSVKRFYATTYAGTVRRRLRDDLIKNREWLIPLAHAYPVRSEPMPLTRVADILIWMDARHH